MVLNETIANLALQALSDESQFLVDVRVSSKNGPQKITVVVDGDHGITIDDCAAVSRQLLKLLEAEPGMSESFTLEVTTPGLEHPLKLRRQYFRNVGREMKVQMNDKTVELGKLAAVSEVGIVLEREEKEGKIRALKKIELSFSEIERAIVQVSFK